MNPGNTVAPFKSTMCWLRNLCQNFNSRAYTHELAVFNSHSLRRGARAIHGLDVGVNVNC